MRGVATKRPQARARRRPARTAHLDAYGRELRALLRGPLAAELVDYLASIRPANASGPHFNPSTGQPCVDIGVLLWFGTW
jgi:hypothetical protein